MSKTVYITLAQLEKAGACEDYREGFRKRFGDKIAVTRANVLKYLTRGFFVERSWWLARLLPAKEQNVFCDMYIDIWYGNSGKPKLSITQRRQAAAILFWKHYRAYMLKAKRG